MSLSMNGGLPSKMNTHASMPPVHEVGRPRYKRRPAYASSGASRQIGGMSVARMIPRLSRCRGAMIKPGRLSWPG